MCQARSTSAGTFQLGGNGVANATERWQDAKERECTSVYDFLTINKHRELAVVSVHECGLNAEFLAKEGRRTGGLNSRDSVATATNRH